MTCGMCGKDIDETQAAAVCKGCPMSGCKLVRCPHCGYEMPREPRWLKWLLKTGKSRSV